MKKIFFSYYNASGISTFRRDNSFFLLFFLFKLNNKSNSHSGFYFVFIFLQVTTGKTSCFPQFCFNAKISKTIFLLAVAGAKHSFDPFFSVSLDYQRLILQKTHVVRCYVKNMDKILFITLSSKNTLLLAVVEIGIIEI